MKEIKITEIVDNMLRINNLIFMFIFLDMFLSIKNIGVKHAIKNNE